MDDDLADRAQSEVVSRGKKKQASEPSKDAGHSLAKVLERRRLRRKSHSGELGHFLSVNSNSTRASCD
jgi:hypothetical protein